MKRGCIYVSIILGVAVAFPIVFVNVVGLPIGANERPRGMYSNPSAKCQNNLKTLSLAIMMWSGDHGEALPRDLGQLNRYLGGHTEVFCCPSVCDVPGEMDDIEEWSSYTYVTNLYSQTLTNTITAFCRSKRHVAYRGRVDTGGHLLIRDGDFNRLEWVPSDAFDRFLSELKTRRTDPQQPAASLQPEGAPSD